MRKLITHTCTLALLLSTSPATLAGPGVRPRVAPHAGAHPRAAEATPPPPAPPLIEEPLLTAIARKVIATADFTGTVIPGQLLNVKLVLPTELGGLAALREAALDVPHGAHVGAVMSASGSGAGGAAAQVAAPAPGESIPCRLWPCGCPQPLSLGPGVQLNSFELRVRWNIFESAGGVPGAALAENQDYQSPAGEGLSRAFVLAPLRVTEYTGAPPPASPYFIKATVTVVANKVVSLPLNTTQVSSAETPLLIPLSLSALEVPKVFVLFIDKDFGRAAAIYLPKATTFQGPSSKAEAKLFEGAGRLLDIYSTTRARLGFVSWFGSYLTGLEELRKVRELEYVDIKERKDSEKNLNEDDFIDPGLLNWNDREVENESSSLLLLGPPGVGAQFFQKRSFAGGQFDVKTGDALGPGGKPPTDYAPAILVRDFLVVETSVPPGKVTVVRKYRSNGKDKTPNNSVSSFKWIL